MADPLPPDPSAAEFKKSWVRPAEALSALHAMGTQVAARQIYRSLCEGMLYAAGSASAMKASGQDDPRPVILPDWWRTAMLTANPASDFWRTAGVTVKARTASARVERREYEFFGVRFEPEGLQRIADDAGVPAAISPRAKLAAAMVKEPALNSPDPMAEAMKRVLEKATPQLVPTLTQQPPASRRKRDNPMTTAEIKAWHRGLSPAQKTLSVTALWDLARQDNPGRHLPRKLVERFGEGRGNGHRAKPQYPKKSSR